VNGTKEVATTSSQWKSECESEYAVEDVDINDPDAIAYGYDLTQEIILPKQFSQLRISSVAENAVKQKTM
jgi:hypothetical protein